MKDVVESHFSAPISAQIWDSKYRFKDPDSTPIDVTVEDTWRRIAVALVEAEPKENRDYWAARFYSALEDFKFLPAGRIISGAGTGRDVTLFNCYVMGTIPDSMSGIFEMLKEAALTMQQGGGIGYDFSTIRPKGVLVKGVGSDASGPLSFMDVWDSMCNTIMSAGARRGAMMATMRCDHPDIEDFITAKGDAARLRKFNLSVLVTDAFMDAVFNDRDWDLIWNGEVMKTVKAVDLWNQIMQSTYDFAEPGVIFIDRINETNNLKAIETISATNPCGEQPLPPYGACLLGSINLTKVVKHPFTSDADIDEDLLRDLVYVAVRMMDNVNDISKFPLPQQLAEAQAKRRIGLGITGLADALAMMEIKYGSNEAVQVSSDIMHLIERFAYQASIELAKEKGPFPAFNKETYLAPGSHIMKHGLDITQQVQEHGIRNSHISSIAPTGTISLYAGNVSSGCEPMFAFSYDRKVLQKDGSHITERVTDYAVNLWEELNPGKDLPDYFVTAQTLTPSDHVRMQAALQEWVDTSISKTINCPEDISFDEFKSVYEEAYNLGCKGCTTYRPNLITGSVLSVEPEKKEEVSVVSQAPDLAEREDVLTGKTYKLKWPGIPHAFYITINDGSDGNPFEIFISTQNVESQPWIAALTRMISAVFRRGGDLSFVPNELMHIHDPQGGVWLNGVYEPSLVGAIGRIVADHMNQELGTGETCSECGQNAVIFTGGCFTCTSCGHSKCG